MVATSPPFSEELLGRTIVAAVSIDVPVRVLLNKVDLVDKLASSRETLARYVALGYPVAGSLDPPRRGGGLREARRRTSPDRTTLLVGQSGMGKSSLLNLLVPDAQAATREISEALQTGKHTTTDARLYALPGSSMDRWPGALIDTPGFQEFGLAHLTPGTVERGFPELAPVPRPLPLRQLHAPARAGLRRAGRPRPRRRHRPRRYDLFAKLTRESASVPGTMTSLR